MNELAKYTDEELKSELKRRAYIRRVETRRMNMAREKWRYWTGTITSVRELKKGISVHRFRFHITPTDKEVRDSFNYLTTEFEVKHKKFRMPTLPRVGDVVRLSYYIHAKEPDYIDESKILEVIKRKGE